MTLDYFYGQSGELFSYFRIPKALFQDHRFRQLSTDARKLYGILLDRMSLSVKKEKRTGHRDHQKRNSAEILSAQLHAPADGKHHHQAARPVATEKAAGKTKEAGRSALSAD